MGGLLVQAFLLGTVLSVHLVVGGKMRFPESAQEETSADKIIDEIITASRAGRNLQLSVGGKDLEPLALASDSTFKELSEKGETEARSYVATKLCSLGLAKCAEGRHGGSGDYGFTNIQDITLVQPVALKPVGAPQLAIPLNKQPYAPVTHEYQTHGKYMDVGSYPTENLNYPSYRPQQQQGGIISSSSPDCSCVSVNQCNSYDIISPALLPSGSGISPGIVSGGIGGRPNYGNVGAGIDPRRNKVSEIESNATVVDAVDSNPKPDSGESETQPRNTRSEITVEDSSSSNDTSSAEHHLSKREVPFLANNSPRIVNGAFRGCYDDRLVCCRNPIKSPSSGSSFPSIYPSNNFPVTNYPSNNYPAANYPSNVPVTNYPSNNNYNPIPTQSYPQRPVSNQYYPNNNGVAPVNNGVCGKRNSNGINGRVLSGTYNGNNAEFGEYPWQAALLKKDGVNSIFVCGASLIDNRHLLTAAHCIKSLRPEELRVRLGEWDVNSENEFYPHVEYDVAAIAIHPEYYAGNLINDLAIIKMVGYVDLVKYPHIAPICLPPRGYDFTGSRCYATGWGKDAFGQSGKFQRILQEVDVPVLSNYDCEQKLRRTRLGSDFVLHQGFVCAGGEPEKDTCKGDGGGPLSCEIGGTWHLGGITSWGVGCGSYGTPGVYARTASYLDWIRQTIQ